ncbi:MAG: cytochrome c biogenesis protein CcsA [Catalinimonas sp.]
MNLLPGQIGEFFTVFMFVSALASAYAFFRTVRLEGQPVEGGAMRRFGRISFGLHAVAVLGVVVTLFYIIQQHMYEYHYAWSHSSNHLPAHFMISCFWEGQEGSFLLWIFWQALLGLGMIAVGRRGSGKTWEAPVMAVFALVQAFLASMILGVMLPGLEWKLGSSPFILLRDAMDAPIFQMNPDFVPEDGTGLNPLLQNYWMVIHPPTLFLGFALTLVPFAFVIAGLWRRDYKGWVRPALPWALTAGGVLGVGILMGAYWAYETLNFGGYWNWDPVENAVYVPWLVLVAAIHTMGIYKKKGAALATSMVLVIASFVLILYSTFLTRSGILGDASVHSFTDLGLSGQLLVYLLAFVGLSVVLLAVRWREVPKSDKEVSVYSPEFWVFTAATILGLAAFQVLVPTSLPVWNAVVEAFGGTSNLAPPADQIAFYTEWQLWFGVAIAFATGLGQYFWWRRLDRVNWFRHLSTPLIVALLVAAALIVLTRVDNVVYIVVLTAGVFSVVANGTVVLRTLRSRTQLAGGGLAHVGVGLMLLGILYSSGYSKVISVNRTGRLYSKEFTDEMNRDNVLLWRGKTQQMADYKLTYQGPRLEVDGFPGYVDPKYLRQLEDPHFAVVRQDLALEGRTYFRAQDTVEVHPENTFFAIAFEDTTGERFTMHPRAQVNPNMGLIASPDLKRFFSHDLYLHVSSIMVDDEEREWSEVKEFTATVGDTFLLNDFVAELVSVDRVSEVEGIELDPKQDAAVQATVRVLGVDGAYVLRPTFVIKDGLVGRLPETSGELGLRLSLLSIDPATGEFAFGAQTTQQDWVIIKAMEKPHINLLWIGSLLMSFGFALATARRVRESRDRKAAPTPTKHAKKRATVGA